MGEDDVLSISDICQMYEDIKRECKVVDYTISRKKVKDLLTDSFSDIEFHQPKRRNNPGRVSLSRARDLSIRKREEFCFSTDAEYIKLLYVYGRQLLNARNGHLMVL